MSETMKVRITQRTHSRKQLTQTLGNTRIAMLHNKTCTGGHTALNQSLSSVYVHTLYM